jgi:ATP-dependent helicase HrpA
LPQLSVGDLDWTIPGWHRDKIAAYLNELPRAGRRDLGSIPELATQVAAKLTPFRGAMVPELVKAVNELKDTRLEEEAFHLARIPDYMRIHCRVIDERGVLVDESRDVDGLVKKYGGKARHALKQAAAPSSASRTGLTKWEFGELFEYVTRRVGDVEVRSYPALVDTGTCVDLTLLESATAADAATRAGLRRLIVIAVRSIVRGIEADVPGSFPATFGQMMPRAQNDAFREIVLARIVTDAFELGEGSVLPRSKSAFDAQLLRGTPQIGKHARALNDAIRAIHTDLTKLLQALKNAEKHPSATLVSREIRAQLTSLLPEDLLTWAPIEKLGYIPRYLRAAGARLVRATTDPQKDLGKAAQLTSLLQAFLAKSETTRDRAALRTLLWDLEELRVSIFAPELKTAYPVTLAKVAAAVSALR